jgi:hypothetical protein
MNYLGKIRRLHLVKEIIKPEPNKLLLFDGMQFHAGNPPLTSSKRIVINMNFRKQ